jgi:hypothetical protein
MSGSLSWNSFLTMVSTIRSISLFSCFRCLRRVKKIAVSTVQMPITEPTTGPAIQVGFKGVGVPDCEGFGVAVPVLWASVVLLVIT